MSSFKYKAFISYGHEDETIARWLHRALETYRPPRGLSLASPRPGHSSAYPLRPIFRDQDELVASTNLSNSLIEALQQSEYLIVICSASAAKSYWTSQEIIEFKKFHGPDNVIAVIADGEPENCFPGPLVQQVLPTGELGEEEIEPLAADLQGGRANRRLALLKVAATMLGTGLDALVQREAQRRHRILALVATAATVAMVVMGWLTYTAITERRAADSARNVAEQRRQEAEALIEFMLGDLRDKLEPVGRLEVLDAVGAQALDYYAGQDQQSLGPESQGRRARALHLLGEISDLKGDVGAALSQFTLAAESTELLMEAEPDNPQRVFDHAQSVFWIGLVAYQQGRFEEAMGFFEQYLAYAIQLSDMESYESKWMLEVFYAHQALGGLAVEMQDWSRAEKHLLPALDALSALRQGGESYGEEWAHVHAWLFSAYLNQKNFHQASIHSQEEVSARVQVLGADSSDQAARRDLVTARRRAAQIALIEGDSDAAQALLSPLYSEVQALKSFEPDHTLIIEQEILLIQDLVEVRFLAGDLPMALEYANACIDQAQALRQRDDSNLHWSVEFEWKCQYLAALVEFRLGRVEAAAVLLDLYYEALVLDYDRFSEQKVATLLLGDTSLLLGDIVYNQQRESEASRLWEQAENVLAGDIDELEPKRIVSLLTALQRQGKKERASELAAYLRSKDYKHPGFMAVGG